jgi:hypothetical protein
MPTLHLMDICYNEQCYVPVYCLTTTFSLSQICQAGQVSTSHCTCSCAAVNFALLISALWAVFMNRLHL